MNMIQKNKLFIAIVFFFAFSNVILANPIFSVGSLFWGEHRIHKQLEGGEPKKKYPATSSGFLLAGIDSSGEYEKFSYKLGMQLLANFADSKSTDLYFREDAYLGIHYDKARFLIGRKNQISQNTLPYNKDGMEGLGLDLKFSENSILELSLLDYYRGYPLLENSLLFTPNKVENTAGNRLRHGVLYHHRQDFWNSNVFFQYLNLGDWGESSKDNVKESPRSDKDFLYHTGFNLELEFTNVKLGLTGILSRGLDKTNSHEVRKSSSLPITGEAILAKLELIFLPITFRYNFFLPDRDKRNESLEVLETGFIGMGTNPMRGKLLSQIVNFYPSGWVTPEGMERVRSIERGRMGSLLNQIELSYVSNSWKITMFLDHCTPYLTIPNRGIMSYQRRDFSKLYIVEGGLSLGMGVKEKGNYFLEFTISALNTSKEIGLKGTIGYISGGIYF